MPAYRAFGYTLHSDIALPELSIESQDETLGWEIRSAPASFVGDLGTALGAEPVYDGVHVRAFASGDVRRLVFDDTGTFEIRLSDRRITWYPGRQRSPVAVTADIVGRVLAFAAHADGHVALHASAVSIGGQAIAFLGAKHAGKSTMAMALVRAGARLITDDMLVVRLGDGRPALAAPGVQRVRLWEDSARALGARTQPAEGVKPSIDCLTPDQLACEAVPLGACYVLGSAEAASAVVRHRVPPPEAAVAVVRYSKLGALAGGPEAAVVLGRAAELIRRLPVFGVTVPRDLGALQSAAASFVAWHAAPAPVS